MLKKIARLIVLSAAVCALGSCDSYKLSDLFTLGSELEIVPQSSSLKPGESTPLFPGNGTEPYTLRAIASDIYDDGTASDLGELDDVGPDYGFTAGTSIGIVKIELRDGDGDLASALISVVPHAPASAYADGSFGGNTEVEISWAYTYPDKIGGFSIWRSKAGAAFSPLAGAEALPKSTMSTIDNNASPGLNVYRIYAVAGAHLSAYAEASTQGKP